MTRINSAIEPNKLTDQHLIAELRELPRIFTAVNKRIETNKQFNDIPTTFKLGSGHVKFFYNKLKFLNDRHSFLRDEYRGRYDKDWGYVPNIDSSIYSKNKLYNDYKPTKIERSLLVERISTRIKESKQIPRYDKEIISKENAIKNLL